MAKIEGVLCSSSNRKELLPIGVLIALAVAVSIYAYWQPRFPGDLRLTLLLQSIYSEPLRLAMEWFSYGSGGWRAALIVVASGIVVWWRLGKLDSALVVAAGLSSLLNSALKVVVNRPRPTPDLVQVFVAEQGNGFPSGHAFFAAVFLGILAYFAFTYLRKRSLCVLALSVLLMLILLIGASRVYLGAHWPSDVIGGYLVGGVFLAALIWFHRTREPSLWARSAKHG